MPRRKPPTPDRSKEALDVVREAKRPDPSASPSEPQARARGSSSDPGNTPTATVVDRRPSERHGPQTPRPTLFGVDRLRAALNLSTDVSIPDLCDEAARELESLRTRFPPLPWPDTPR